MKRVSVRLFSLPILVALLLWGSVGSSHAFKLPDTGQTSSYSTGDDGSYSINPMSFTAPGDGTVTDNNTGLVWQQQDDGIQRPWSMLDAYCKSLTLPGSGWRLPTKKELVSIVDFSSYPTIKVSYFPNTRTDLYATSTVAVSPPFIAGGRWAIGFDGRGIDAIDSSAYQFYARCVRGSTAGAYGNLTDNGDGTVVDVSNNFMWQQGEAGTMGWNAALIYCENLSLAGYSDWRLPNIKELESLTDDNSTPAFSKTLFPGLQTPGPYWSSTTDANSTGSAWNILSGLGRIYSAGKTAPLVVRCLRGGQTGGLVKLTVARGTGAGSGTVTANFGGINCGNRCSAYFDPSAALTVTLTAAPSADSVFTSWTGACTGSQPTCTVAMSSAKTATATFTQVPTYTLTVGKTGSGTVTSIPSAISCGTKCSAAFAAGSSVTLSAAPAAGWYLSGWGSECDIVKENTCTVSMSKARSVSVAFTSGTSSNQLIVSKSGSGVGTITSPSGINCGDVCSASFAPGTTVTLTAAAASGSRLTGWSGCDSPSGNLCTVTVNGQKVVSANFEWGRNLNVAVSKAGDGLGIVLSRPSGIRCGGDCSETYADGTVVTLIAVPDTGSSFTGWNGACSGVVAPICRVTMNKDNSAGAAFEGGQPAKADTMLSLVLSSRSILKTGTIRAGGRLTRLPDLGNDLGGLPITLKITAPDGSITTRTATTSDSGGAYLFPAFGSFSLKGTYTLRAYFDGNSRLMPSSSSGASVVVSNIPGYAVIVEGSVPNGEGLPSHNKTANRIYESLKERGFTDDNIMYFNTQGTQSGVDDNPSKQDIAEAVKTWAQSKMNALSGPFYLIMVDHGDSGTFYIGSETITHQDISLWLDTLEGGLNASAKIEPRVVVIGSCFSGSFIPRLSKEGRLIITSARPDEQSYKGPMEQDTIRSGEFFMDELFDFLKRGTNIRKAFEGSALKTMAYTKSGSGSLYEMARQHPLLDDNADGKGSTLLAGKGDGTVAAGLYLGYGNTYDPTALDNPAELKEVTPTLFLDSATSSAGLWAEANFNSLVSAAWAEVKSPAAALSAASNQLDLNLPRLPLTLTGPSGRWEGSYNSFTAGGTHEVYYLVSDKNSSKTTSMMKSLVYKNREGNAAPSAFNLTSPADDAVQTTVLAFEWEESADADGLTYTLLLSKKEDFSTVDYIKEEIPYNSTVLGVEDNLSDVTVWYWKVLAIDSYGAKTESSESRSFVTVNNNTNGFKIAAVSGVVLDDATKQPIYHATVSSSKGGSMPTLSDGFYYLKSESGPLTLGAEAAGYKRQDVSASPADGESLVMNFNLTPDNPCAAVLGNDVSLHIPVVNVSGTYLWVDLVYDPTRTDAVVFELTTGYGLLTDVSAYSACQAATFSLDTLKLTIPDIVFGTMKLSAEMALETNAGSRVLFDVTNAVIK